MPAEPVTFAQGAAYQRPKQRSQVDAHIENGITRVPAGAALRVQFADDGADIRFQQAGAEHHQHQADVESGDRRDGQGKMAEHDDDAPVPDGILGADHTVCYPAARQRRQVHGCRVQAVNRGGGHVIHAQATFSDSGGHEQHQKGPHAVIAEAFPHLREEQGTQSRRVYRLSIRQCLRIGHSQAICYTNLFISVSYNIFFI